MMFPLAQDTDLVAGDLPIPGLWKLITLSRQRKAVGPFPSI